MSRTWRRAVGTDRAFSAGCRHTPTSSSPTSGARRGAIPPLEGLRTLRSAATRASLPTTVNATMAGQGQRTLGATWAPTAMTASSSAPTRASLPSTGYATMGGQGRLSAGAISAQTVRTAKAFATTAASIVLMVPATTAAREQTTARARAARTAWTAARWSEPQSSAGKGAEGAAPDAAAVRERAGQGVRMQLLYKDSLAPRRR
mmetsp:Transcript_24778/g.69413  ORF Transcript_24778/g.69413 Transcript_24778/m.69413 type:complete len:204 (+) Transcript_24778:1529-2140(+)